MEQNQRPSVPPYLTLALFEGEAGAGTATAEPATTAPAVVTPKPAVAAPAAPAAEPDIITVHGGGRVIRDPDTGRFQPLSADPKDVQAALDSANGLIEATGKRRSEMRAEEQQRVRSDLENVQRNVAASDKRAIRAEVRVAVSKLELIDPEAEDDVVDGVLRAHGDKIQIDKDSGDVKGVKAAVAAFKEGKAFFFKPAAAAGAAGAAGATGAAAAANPGGARPTATSAGASPAGGGTGEGDSVGGLPKNYKDLTSAEQDAAMRDYRRTVRGQRGR